MLDLIIKNGQCYIDNKLINIDLGIKEGKIVEIGNIDKESKEKFNAGNLIVSIGDKVIGKLGKKGQVLNAFKLTDKFNSL